MSFTLNYTGDSAKDGRRGHQRDRRVLRAAERLDAVAISTAAPRSSSASSSPRRRRSSITRKQAVTRYTTKYTGQLPQQVGVNLATLERMNTQLRLNGEQQIRLIEQREKLLEGLDDPNAIARAPRTLTPRRR